MAWKHLHIDVLQEFASLSGSGWAVIDVPPAYDPEEEGAELSIAQRVRQRREKLLAQVTRRPLKKAAAR